MLALLLDGTGDGACDEEAGARVGGVALDHDRAPCGQRGGGVAAGGGEGEREVAGPEDGDRAERDVALADVGARERLAVGQRRVDPDAEVVAATYDAGEHAQLAGGAADLAGDAASGRWLSATAASTIAALSDSISSATASRKAPRCSGVVAR